MIGLSVQPKNIDTEGGTKMEKAEGNDDTDGCRQCVRRKRKVEPKEIPIESATWTPLTHRQITSTKRCTVDINPRKTQGANKRGSKRVGTKNKNCSFKDNVSEERKLSKNGKKHLEENRTLNSDPREFVSKATVGQQCEGENRIAVQDLEVTDIKAKCSECLVTKNISTARSRRNSPRVRNPSHETASSPTNKVDSKLKGRSSGKCCRVPRPPQSKVNKVDSLDQETLSLNVKGKFVEEEDLTESDDTPRSPNEEINVMPCYSQIMSLGQIETEGGLTRISADLSCATISQFNSSSASRCSESEDCTTDTSYATCCSSWCQESQSSTVETVGGQYPQEDTEAIKSVLKKRIEALIAECETTEIRLRSGIEEDETNELQCNIIKSARESAMVQLESIPSVKNDKLVIKLLQKRIQILKQVLHHSNDSFGNHFNLKHVLDVISKGIDYFINSESEDSSRIRRDNLSEHISNVLLFCVAIAVLYYVYQF